MPKVLLVEDDTNLAAATCDYLRRRNYEVEHVAYGAKAIVMLQTGKYEVAVLDITLPDIDGFTICKRVRQDGNEVPILFLTAKNELADVVSGMNLGADGYMSKPFHLSELEARIRAMIRRPPANQPRQLHLGKLMVDLDRNLVSAEGKPVDIRRREFAILSILISAKGKVVGRSEIMDQLTAKEFAHDGTVDVHISRLRKAIGSKYIETIHGKGYRVAMPAVG